MRGSDRGDRDFTLILWPRLSVRWHRFAPRDRAAANIFSVAHDHDRGTTLEYKVLPRTDLPRLLVNRAEVYRARL